MFHFLRVPLAICLKILDLRIATEFWPKEWKMTMIDIPLMDQIYIFEVPIIILFWKHIHLN